MIATGTWSIQNAGTPTAGEELQILVADPASPLDRWHMSWLDRQRKAPRRFRSARVEHPGNRRFELRSRRRQPAVHGAARGVGVDGEDDLSDAVRTLSVESGEKTEVSAPPLRRTAIRSSRATRIAAAGCWRPVFARVIDQNASHHLRSPEAAHSDQGNGLPFAPRRHLCGSPFVTTCLHFVEPCLDIT